MKSSIITFIVLIVFTLSCSKIDKKTDNLYPVGVFADTIINMGAINSEFDDYNSAFNFVGSTSPLCFSSKRNSVGSNFDIIYKMLDVNWNTANGILKVAEFTNTSNVMYDINIENENLKNALSQINTTSDELGPYLIARGQKNKGAVASNLNKKYYSYIFLYASNKDGNQNIYYTHNSDTEIYTIPKPISFLNSNKDDAYPTLNKDSSAIYFCSNRNYNFDIFKVELPSNKTLFTNITDTATKTVVRDNILSSEHDDKCPYIMGNMMVFTSNRSGGFGGFDLYYSIFSNGQWGMPINFGNKVNSPYDEYRPIITAVYGFDNNFMIFSSNRPGGKGGFDLYYVGTKKI